MGKTKALIKAEKIIKNIEEKISQNDLYLDFNESNTKEYTHCYHSYPAMMIPQLAREFISATINESNITNIFDPFMGSGTTIVEGKIAGLETYGNDINPLSELMATVKANPIDPQYLEEEKSTLLEQIHFWYERYQDGSYRVTNLPTFDRLDFWFKKEITEVLQLIKNCIIEIEDEIIKKFFLAAFSETVRYVSNTRNNEFKLYKMAEETLEDWNPDVIDIFTKFLNRNINGNSAFVTKLAGLDDVKPTHITRGSSMELNNYEIEKFDLLVTSPPYGDSKTTVAYGQFSRLSLQWLDLSINENTKLNQLDNIMLGGKVNKKIEIEEILQKLNSPTLKEIYFAIAEEDVKRANEVLQFYIDMDITLKRISQVMKPDSLQYWVVANRTVKGIQIPTDDIIIELFKKHGISYLHRFYRNIPKKRMPAKNSPTNKSGKLSATMTKEIIIMLKK